MSRVESRHVKRYKDQHNAHSVIRHRSDKASTTYFATSSLSFARVKTMSTFNHTPMYHNSNLFVLVEYTKRFKRCRGCMSKFDNPKFVIRSGRASTAVGTNCQPASVEWRNVRRTFTAILPASYRVILTSSLAKLLPVRDCLWNWLLAISNYWNRTRIWVRRVTKGWLMVTNAKKNADAWLLNCQYLSTDTAV